MSCTRRHPGGLRADTAASSAFLTLGLVFSWGDGDFGKLGRGGSEGCNVPQNIERLNGQGVCQIECGAQFSLALTKSGVVWTWYVDPGHAGPRGRAGAFVLLPRRRGPPAPLSWGW